MQHKYFSWFFCFYVRNKNYRASFARYTLFWAYHVDKTLRKAQFLNWVNFLFWLWASRTHAAQIFQTPFLIVCAQQKLWIVICSLHLVLSIKCRQKTPKRPFSKLCHVLFLTLSLPYACSRLISAVCFASMCCKLSYKCYLWASPCLTQCTRTKTQPQHVAEIVLFQKYVFSCFFPRSVLRTWWKYIQKLHKKSSHTRMHKNMPKNKNCMRTAVQNSQNQDGCFRPPYAHSCYISAHTDK